MSSVMFSFHSALRHMKTNPLRTLLTLLQVVLGALAMTIALSAYLSTQKNRGPSELFTVLTGKAGSDLPAVFQDEGLLRLLELAPDVENLATYEFLGAARVEYQGQRFQFRTAAKVSPGYFNIADINLVRGSFFTDQDTGNQEGVMLLSEEAARGIFGDVDPIGQELALIYNQASVDQRQPPPPIPLRVVGVYEDVEEGRVLSRDRPPVALFPSWARHDYQMAPLQKGVASVPARIGASALKVISKPGRGVTAREQVVAAAMQEYPYVPGRITREETTFVIQDPGDELLSEGIADTTLLIFGLFGIVALVIGSIGIFSATVVDVVERTHEVGLRRALGASGRRISTEFLTETGILAALGGLLGVALAVPVVPWLKSQLGDNLLIGVELTWQPVASVVVLAVVIFVSAGLGLLPALQAVKLTPVEAIKEA